MISTVLHLLFVVIVGVLAFIALPFLLFGGLIVFVFGACFT